MCHVYLYISKNGQTQKHKIVLTAERHTMDTVYPYFDPNVSYNNFNFSITQQILCYRTSAYRKSIHFSNGFESAD